MKVGKDRLIDEAVTAFGKLCYIKCPDGRCGENASGWLIMIDGKRRRVDASDTIREFLAARGLLDYAHTFELRARKKLPQLWEDEPEYFPVFMPRTLEEYARMKRDSSGRWIKPEEPQPAQDKQEKPPKQKFPIFTY